ncbi:hypothetical protein NDU88_004271 [Pleurodeles waltl]|uniref:ribonuclease H n=1 Tax=Pleurodeles waltl TaxID=8319 RepID=A0AAV7UGM7_PLEWA|nr:hypothetical protein NDU88_004271 [Pleurodeles waltl]
MEGSPDPLEYQLDPQMDWVQDLRDASGLDTSPDTGMLSPPTAATEEGASYSVVVRRVAECLGPRASFCGGGVLQIVRREYYFPFETSLPAMPPSYSQILEDHMVLLREEVQALLAKRAIEKVPLPEVGRGCYSCNFLVLKKDKGLQPILDLRSLSLFLKFKMLTLAQVLSALDPGDWMVAFDLQDAYFHIPVLPAHRRYLRFVVGHKHFQFTVLPFGVTSVPWVFTKVMVAVAAHLRRLVVPVFPYLDDWLLKGNLPQTVISHLQTMANLLLSLGFTIIVPKSHLTLSQTLPFI